MAVFYLLTFIILLFGVRIQKQGFFSDHLEIDQTNAIKGFFILMVFISHCMLDIKKAGYEFVSGFDAVGMQIRSELGQLVVVMFLFYSGYGVMESYAKKGKEYVRTFPKKRILTTLLNFDIAVLAFVVLDLALGIKLGLKQVVLSLTGWESVGNSNWYIFVVLFCYIVAYVAFLVVPNNGRKAMWMASVLVVMGMIVLSCLKPSRWYNTILCFPAGMCLSAYKDRIVTFCKEHYLGALLIAFVVFMAFHWSPLPSLHGLVYNIQGIAFALLTVLLTMKVKTGNVVLQWLGVSLFPIYIYQRIPMIAITKLAGEGFVCNHPYVFVVSCFLVTCTIALGYRFWRIKVR
jgi:hypothetical protein